MKLEPELIKEILIWCEENLPSSKGILSASELKIDDYSKDQIIFHIRLLVNEGYIKAIDSSADDYVDYLLCNLTMNGYQYLNLLRSKAWNIAKGMLHEGSVIFVEGAIKAIIDKYIP